MSKRAKACRFGIFFLGKPGASLIRRSDLPMRLPEKVLAHTKTGTGHKACFAPGHEVPNFFRFSERGRRWI